MNTHNTGGPHTWFRFHAMNIIIDSAIDSIVLQQMCEDKLMSWHSVLWMFLRRCLCGSLVHESLESDPHSMHSTLLQSHVQRINTIRGLWPRALLDHRLSSLSEISHHHQYQIVFLIGFVRCLHKFITGLVVVIAALANLSKRVWQMFGPGSVNLHPWKIRSRVYCWSRFPQVFSSCFFDQNIILFARNANCSQKARFKNPQTK